MIIRRAKLSDWPAIMHIEHSCFNNVKHDFAFALGLPFNHNLVAIKDGKIVSYHTYEWLVGKRCHLISLGTLKEYRHQGMGGKLMEESIKIAKKKKAKEIYFEVRKHNTGAIRLYQKLGYRVIKTKPKYYKAPVDDCLIMAYMPEKNNDLDDS